MLMEIKEEFLAIRRKELLRKLQLKNVTMINTSKIINIAISIRSSCPKAKKKPLGTAIFLKIRKTVIKDRNRPIITRMYLHAAACNHLYLRKRKPTPKDKKSIIPGCRELKKKASNR
jgi:hypothetical protein